MTRAALLERDEIERGLEELPGWKYEENRLKRTYRFPAFLDGIEFVREVAGMAEEMNHHPDIFIRFHLVSFELTTHGSKGVTHLDLELARKIHGAAAGKAKDA